MTKEKALEKINGDFDHATKYITGLYGLEPDFWKENALTTKDIAIASIFQRVMA